MTQDIEQLAQQLEQHPDYRVLRRLVPGRVFNTPAPGQKLKKGVVLDTETTGLKLEAGDRIIELGMLAFDFDPITGIIYSVTDRFNELEDPLIPIPPESTAIHHISNDDVKGKRIDDHKVEKFLENAVVVIAHNAGFDRPFVEERWPIFKQFYWGCSLYDVNWKQEKLASGKLEFLLSSKPFSCFYDAHRAEIDCWALLELLNGLLPESQEKCLLTVLNTIRQPQKKIYAMGSPFESKDALKKQGYRWSADLRCWSRVISGEQELQKELGWLKNNVYGERNAVVEIETLGGKVRYSNREGMKEQILIA